MHEHTHCSDETIPEPSSHEVSKIRYSDEPFSEILAVLHGELERAWDEIAADENAVHTAMDNKFPDHPIFQESPELLHSLG